MVTAYNLFWSLLSVVAEGIVIVLAVSLISKKENKFVIFWRKHALGFAFIVALLSMLGSLGYSNVIGYTPCTLCWFQRICMYSQVVILAIALCKRDRGALVYSFWLSSAGILFSAYHCLLERGFVPDGFCTATGGVSCAQNYVFILGYITIPMMALSAFALIMVTAIVGLKKEAAPLEIR